MRTSARPPGSVGIAAHCGRALCGWSPAPLPADTPTKTAVDRVLSRTEFWAGVVVVITALFNLAPDLPERADLALVGLAALLGGGICSLNFWRCRHAHCLLTGPGWLMLAAFVFTEAGIGHSLIGGWEQPAFITMLALSLAFEGGWYLMRGTNAVARVNAPRR